MLTRVTHPGVTCHPSAAAQQRTGPSLSLTIKRSLLKPPWRLPTERPGTAAPVPRKPQMMPVCNLRCLGSSTDRQQRLYAGHRHRDARVRRKSGFGPSAQRMPSGLADLTANNGALEHRVTEREPPSSLSHQASVVVLRAEKLHRGWGICFQADGEKSLGDVETISIRSPRWRVYHPLHRNTQTAQCWWNTQTEQNEGFLCSPTPDLDLGAQEMKAAPHPVVLGKHLEVPEVLGPFLAGSSLRQQRNPCGLSLCSIDQNEFGS